MTDAEICHDALNTSGVDRRSDVDRSGEKTYLERDEELLRRAPVPWVCGIILLPVDKLVVLPFLASLFGVRRRCHREGFFRGTCTAFCVGTLLVVPSEESASGNGMHDVPEGAVLDSLTHSRAEGR